MLRIYSAPDGSPAEYAEENIPLKPRHHLPVTLNGVDKNDFAMVMGYPGSTDRYRTSYGLELTLEQINPTRIDLRETRLDIWKEIMDRDKEVRLMYASKFASVANYWKYFIGQSEGIRNLDLLERKRELENEFKEWYSAEKARKDKYGNALNMFEEGYKELKDPNLNYLYVAEGAFGMEIMTFAYKHEKLFGLLDSLDAENESVQEEIKNLKENADAFYKDYHAPTDKKVVSALIKKFDESVPSQNKPSVFEDINDKFKGDYQKYADVIFDKSVFRNKEAYLEFLDDPSRKALEKDWAFRTMHSIMDHYKTRIYPKRKEINDKIDIAARLFIDGIRKMNPEKSYYPDANSTMRISYGQVLDYIPRDAVKYHFLTTASGILEKENPEDPEFIVPEELKELISNKDFGRYADENGELIVGFITNNDITGGNSGSPVINAKGELIGIAFDGNWEAMSGDIAFEPDLQRCINVDIRYVLFVIDKLSGAGHLVDEMTVVEGTEETRAVPEEVPETEEVEMN
jgi:hypothetical protein